MELYVARFLYICYYILITPLLKINYFVHKTSVQCVPKKMLPFEVKGYSATCSNLPALPPECAQKCVKVIAEHFYACIAN